jgi:hypothetical protein
MTDDTRLLDPAGYEADFYLWTQAQAAALRAAGQAGANVVVDWENVAEEIESLGRRDAREVRSRLRQIMVHLLKLTYSPADAPKTGWKDEVSKIRLELDAVLADSPSLRQRVSQFIGEEWPRAMRLAAKSLAQYGEDEAADRMLAEAASYDATQLLDDWFPGGVG